LQGADTLALENDAVTLRAAGRRKDTVRQPWGAITAFLLPALLFYTAFTAYPVLRTIWNSFHKVLPRREDELVGLANYTELLFTDAIFWRSVGNTIIWACISPLAEISIALVLALMLYAKVPGRRFFRIAWFTPVLMSYVVVGILWVWIYNYDWGAMNSLLRALGLGSWARAWLGDPTVALPALILITTWMWSGFNMVVLLAGMHSLPSEVLEAAELDNCGWGAKLVHVIIPLLKPTILNLLILSFIGKMKIFDLVWITTRGGPLWATETVSTYVYKRAFEWTTFDLGYPSTVATVWFVIVLSAVLFLSWLFRKRERLEF
jgi:ABC-type sugar transport system permease subunit